MRNLKRALSLALAAVMLIGMMVVGASAVSYNDFTDRDEIVNKDAVSMLTTLGVIDGKTDGSFDPEGTVRRDEMAKMISVIMNQGVDNNELYSGVDSKLTDIGDNWAKGHINYCYTLGIIANTVTETEIPDWMAADGVAQCFKTTILSSKVRLRKPDPEIYHLACRCIGTPEASCAYVGDNPVRDVEGTQAAGFGMMIRIDEPDTLNMEHATGKEFTPDHVITSLSELLDIFPARNA